MSDRLAPSGLLTTLYVDGGADNSPPSKSLMIVSGPSVSLIVSTALRDVLGAGCMGSLGAGNKRPDCSRRCMTAAAMASAVASTAAGTYSAAGTGGRPAVGFLLARVLDSDRVATRFFGGICNIANNTSRNRK